jgi:hypothetical protein
MAGISFVSGENAQLEQLKNRISGSRGVFEVPMLKYAIAAKIPPRTRLSQRNEDPAGRANVVRPKSV